MKKILVIDDSSFMRSILKELLTDKDEPTLSVPVEITEADGKTNAIKQLKKIHPDIILVDVVMQESETEGVEFIREVKDNFDTKKIIIISSIGQASIIDECSKLGIFAYLQKPFDKNLVIDTVNKVLATCK